jgi:hypothetical protein
MAQRLVDVEDDQDRSISYGQWVRRDGGIAALRVPRGCGALRALGRQAASHWGHMDPSRLPM